MSPTLGRQQTGVAPNLARNPLAAELTWPDDALEVGRILGAWGIKGWLKVQPFSTDAQALLTSSRWYLKPPGDTAAQQLHAVAASRPAFLSIREARIHGDGVVALAEGYNDRGSAESLQGVRLFVARANFPQAGKDEYYWVDLIGLAVRTRQGEPLGTVVGLLDTGPHSVLRIQRQVASTSEGAEAEILIPFVAAYVDDVNLEQRLITVDWGLDF